jgi:hypothetical protein
MTKEEFRQSLWNVTKHLQELIAEVGDMLPTAINQTKWVAEEEVPVHLFLFTAHTFAQNMEELQTWFK